MGALSPRGSAFRLTLLCVDRYEDGVPAGRFYHPSRPEGAAFQSLSQLLLGMEAMMDVLRFPQSFTEPRRFSAPPAKPRSLPAPPPELCRTGELATFSLRLLFRQHASWQGEITWLEGSRTQPFRSVLELILLLDSALSAL